MRFDFNRSFAPQYEVALSSDSSKLDLSSNFLGKRENTEIGRAFEVFPTSVGTLNLSWNNLGDRTNIDLRLIFAVLLNITNLDLRSNNLGKHSSEKLVEAFSLLTPSLIKTLNLSWNKLGSRTGPELANIFAILPAELSILNLSWNDLGDRTGVELAQGLRALPKTLTALDLTGNNLGKLPIAERELVFAAIPPVKTLNLTTTHLESLPEDQWIRLISLLPSSVDEIIIGGDEANQELITSFLQRVRRSQTLTIIREKNPLIEGVDSLMLDYVFNPISFWNKKPLASSKDHSVDEKKEGVLEPVGAVIAV